MVKSIIQKSDFPYRQVSGFIIAYFGDFLRLTANLNDSKNCIVSDHRIIYTALKFVFLARISCVLNPTQNCLTLDCS
ncbi:MAG: hypothetical protein UT18_C0029G0015 [candidate division CPR2 bacterium GW2011_GWC2_39_10]|uniref:Uncharacterized protein n=1 Tax=candidate division CPR2 bacterium GW2011_GWC2_39_10 TaxID=1618345 RepID=A0A0G0LM99_UNCC2|nr:MAG: hypothetical protein UT18_C0029G0015 [candidate division CPR2 bacterium GW2011_GWC2_39_10]